MKPTIKLIGLIFLSLYFYSCKEDPKPPSLATKDITEITGITAISGGTILDDGGGPIIDNGVCWSTTIDQPTIDENKTMENISVTYVSTLTQLSPNTTYYVRAYATNTGGTGYGNSISFTTMGDEPTVMGSSVINLGVNTATLSCSINPNFVNTTVNFEWGTTTSYGYTAAVSQNPLTGGNPVNVSVDLTGLESEITYNFRIKATNDLGTIYSDNLSFKTFAAVDGDGNGYYSVTIGTQTWLIENLKTTKYNDGTNIPNVTDSIAWKALTTGAYCNYRNKTDPSFIATYGRLYNWYAVNSGKLAPAGWHIPTHNEWNALVTFLGGQDVAGGKMKEAGIIHWQTPNIGATNESGFSALPSGYRGPIITYEYQSLGKHVAFWESTIYTGTQAYGLVLRYNEITSETYIFNKAYGFPVRLIKD
jgi:uncharacterized protein (TIGR02145 family)